MTGTPEQKAQCYLTGGGPATVLPPAKLGLEELKMAKGKRLPVELDWFNISYNSLIRVVDASGL